MAHLDDDDRTLVLGVILEQILAWVRPLPGTQKLRALIAMDEVYGMAPPHPANPPTKRPLVSLGKQARAFGVGMLLATQNPMDLDYRALSNAGMWFVGRIQTDADRARGHPIGCHRAPQCGELKATWRQQDVVSTPHGGWGAYPLRCD